jgi:hypothetical protein
MLSVDIDSSCTNIHTEEVCKIMKDEKTTSQYLDNIIIREIIELLYVTITQNI